VADFVSELGTALKTAINADGATFGQALGVTGGAYHVEYGDQPITYLQQAGSRCYIRFERENTLWDSDASAETEFHFMAAFKLADLKGKQGALTLVKKGVAAVLTNAGRTVLNTHLTDSASNRLAKSGIVEAEIDVQPLDALDSIDHPLVFVRFKVTCAHVMPLV
jgi:hypothetical protein